MVIYFSLYDSFGRRPINVVVGAPIPVPKVEGPADEEVDRVHATYVAALTNLYEGINSTHSLENPNKSLSKNLLENALKKLHYMYMSHFQNWASLTL